MRILMLLWLFLVPILANFFGIDMVLVSGQCQGDQRSLLLQLKSSLKFNANQSVHLVNWSANTDCCKWSGVDCDVNGHVTGLNLSSESISSGIENPTGLFSLQYLQSLNLAFNQFNASQIPSRLANLSNLTHLNLSSAGFAGQIPVEISRMTRLVFLDLSTVSFPGSHLLKLENPNLKVLVQNLTMLRELYLDGVNISAEGKEWCQALATSLPTLQVLSLSTCFLTGPIHPALVNLRLLSVIRLDQNNLSSSVPEFLADLSNLTSLHLRSCGLNGKFPEKIFQVPTLETLDLSNNRILQGSLPEIPENFSIQTLVLFDTNFSGTLPHSIGNLKKLSRMELARCRFTGAIPSLISILTEIVYLDLSNNSFTGQIPSFHMSENLTYLDLSYNVLSGGISFTKWERLQNLGYVDLRFNSFNGSIPPSLFVLPSLRKLLLSKNQFQGLLDKFSNASSSVLDTIDLNGNRLEGPIPKSLFSISTLHSLVLSSNKFNGTIQLDALQKLRNLGRLDLSYNNLKVNASSGSHFLPQIAMLRLASCNLSMIPNLKNQSTLFHLDLSDNQISGEVPNWIWEVGNGLLSHLNLSRNQLMGLQEPYSIPSLTVLDLNYNQLRGMIPKPPATTAYVDYSCNSFTSIPPDIGNFLNYTIFFSLSNNSLTGVIPESICNAMYLQVLDLSSNKLSGMVPTCLIERMDDLVVLNLRRNKLNGFISGTFPRKCGLQTLDLNGNQLQGMLPKSLANCAMLEVLDLGNNWINDTFPCWLKTVSSLRVLVLRSNQFYGKIGCPEVNGNWARLQIVDLASNYFTGKLPGKGLTAWQAMMVNEDEAQSNFNYLHFEFLKLSGLHYQDAVTVTSKGLEMELVKILTVFTSIDMSCNKFEGPIPDEIGLLNSLCVLNLSHTALTGPIPSNVGNLRQLESLDLSMNRLSGAIPSQLASLNFLSYLNLSYNQFVGRIPTGTQIQSFSATSFEGNEGLCGAPLPDNCSNSTNIQPHLQTNCKDSRKSPHSCNGHDWQVSLVIGVGFGIGFLAAVSPMIFSDKVNRWYDILVYKFLSQFRK